MMSRVLYYASNADLYEAAVLLIGAGATVNWRDPSVQPLHLVYVSEDV